MRHVRHHFLKPALILCLVFALSAQTTAPTQPGHLDPATIALSYKVITQSLPLLYGNATQAAKDMAPLFPQCELIADEASNTLQFTAPSINVRLLAQLIAACDKKEGFQVTVFRRKLINSQATDLRRTNGPITVLPSILGRGAAGEIEDSHIRSFLSKPLIITIDPPENALVIACDQSLVQQMKNSLDIMDRAPPSSNPASTPSEK